MNQAPRVWHFIIASFLCHFTFLPYDTAYMVAEARLGSDFSGFMSWVG